VCIVAHGDVEALVGGLVGAELGKDLVVPAIIVGDGIFSIAVLGPKFLEVLTQSVVVLVALCTLGVVMVSLLLL
jgi:hypothetical protein